jgi:hypothetical protein
MLKFLSQPLERIPRKLTSGTDDTVDRIRTDEFQIHVWSVSLLLCLLLLLLLVLMFLTKEKVRKQLHIG